MLDCTSFFFTHFTMNLNERQRSAVQSFIDPNAGSDVHEENLEFVLQQVRDNQLALEVLVRNLGEALTSLDDLVRSRGLQLVAEVLMQVPDLCLSPQNASTFAQFLAARLQDFPCVTQAIDAIHALVRHHKLYCQVRFNSLYFSLYNHTFLIVCDPRRTVTPTPI